MEHQVGKYAFRTETGWYIEWCPTCEKENYSMAVASGTCAFCGWEPVWHTNKGKTINLVDMTDEHILNIIKFFYSINRHNICPFLMAEAGYRGLLQVIAKGIKKQTGYKSPKELLGK